MTETKSLPQRASVRFWQEVRKELEAKPNELIKVNTYNHPTIAYRARRDIIRGLNSIFPEVGQWNAIVIKDTNNKFIAERSRRWTYRHDLFMVYLPRS